MIWVFICAGAALFCYLMGYYTGKRYAEEKLELTRAELGLYNQGDWDLNYKKGEFTRKD